MTSTTINDFCTNYNCPGQTKPAFCNSFSGGAGGAGPGPGPGTGGTSGGGTGGTGDGGTSGGGTSGGGTGGSSGGSSSGGGTSSGSSKRGSVVYGSGKKIDEDTSTKSGGGTLAMLKTIIVISCLIGVISLGVAIISAIIYSISMSVQSAPKQRNY